MIVGIGTDIIEVKRVKKSLENTRFATKIFTEKEIAYCQKFKNFHIHYAARFTAKESVLKALGTGLIGKMTFKDIEVENDKLGKPYLNFRGEVKRIIEEKNIGNIHLSMTHTAEYASSIVILEKNK